MGSGRTPDVLQIVGVSGERNFIGAEGLFPFFNQFEDFSFGVGAGHLDSSHFLRSCQGFSFKKRASLRKVSKLGNAFLPFSIYLNEEEFIPIFLATILRLILVGLEPPLYAPRKGGIPHSCRMKVVKFFTAWP